MPARSVIQVSGLTKRYGTMTALSDVAIDVRDGEIFGLIGPNGAGKTTAMECIEGLRVPDAGRISVLGLDPLRDVAGVAAPHRRPAAGSAAAEAHQGARSARALVVALRHARSTAWQLLEQLGIAGKANALVHDAVGRPEAAAVHRARAHPRSGARVSRRADHRPRSAGAPRDLGSRARHPRSRQDGVPHHAPDGGSRAALRSRRHHRPRAHRRRRLAGRPRAAALSRAHDRHRDRRRARDRRARPRRRRRVSARRDDGNDRRCARDRSTS